ncbi:MAG: DNA polymerase III subunit delta', partial [Pseudomonadota bacterium]|nr:DNA polymerase III subunit delta' [Pseudomonadota bacterium]
MPAPDPRANPLLLGHPDAEATILDAIRAGRTHHAWLITGPEGVGKATLAYRFARRLLAGQPSHRSPEARPPDGASLADTLALDSADPVFRRVAAGSHADLLTIERVLNEKTRRMKTQIAVEDVRRINGFMSLTPAEGGWR